MSEVPNVNTTSSTPVEGAAAANAPKGAAAGYTNETEVGSLKELKEKAPEVHKAMLEGIAQSIISKMKKSQERLKKMWNESRRQD